MKKTLSILLLLSIVVATIASFLCPSDASADYSYITYTPTSNCHQGNIYTANIITQTFRTGFSSISSTSVSLYLYRFGSPGLVYLNISSVDSSGYPTGSVLASSSYSGNNITTSSTGEIINFSFSTPCVLNKNTNYSIVLSTPSGSAIDYINILCRDTSQLYADGKFETSSNSGSIWTINTSRSALFILNGGPTSIAINDVKVFKNIFEPNDRLFVVNYDIRYAIPPRESPSTLFGVVLLGFSSRPLNTFNSSVISIYLPAVNATVWKDPETIWISGNSLYFNGSLMRASYSVDDASYVDSLNMELGRAGLWSYMTGLAGIMGTANGIAYTFSSIYYGTILNTDGCVIFEQAIPGLGTVFPLVGFYLSKVSTEGAYFNYTQAPANLSLQNSFLGLLGTQTDTAFNGLATYLAVPSGFLKGIFGLFLYAIIASIIFLVSGDSTSSLILAFPAVCFGVLIGLIPVALVFIFVFFMIVTMAYYVWLH